MAKHKELPLTNSDEKALVDYQDYLWAKNYEWRIHVDGHVVRDGMDQDGNAKVIYLCNEVMSRQHGIPLTQFGPPRSRN